VLDVPFANLAIFIEIENIIWMITGNKYMEEKYKNQSFA
jgi:hypothetical protein